MRRHRFARSRWRIEIDLTWQCNLSCFDCNRCCGVAPTGEKMSVAQIERFIAESKRRRYEWRIIRLVGGEPTLHPQFAEIVDLLVSYRRSFAHKKAPAIILCTNGYSDRTKQIIEKLPAEVSVDNSRKDVHGVVHIGHFNVAPVDVRDTSGDDFTMACTNATYCGLGLTPNGYYHCPVAGSIDRIFGFDLGRNSLPEIEDDMHDTMERFCRLCGFFDMDDQNIVPARENLRRLVSQPEISRSWRSALTRLRDRGRHELTKY